MFENEVNIPIVEIKDPLLAEHGVELFMKREDLLDEHVSGNKWRKLQYNLEAAQEQGHKILLTFGGAFSNHIAAVAAAGKKYGFSTVGIIRGEENLPLNDTLSFATACGMRLEYLSREAYRQKDTPELRDLWREKYGDYYLLPEGGSNALAVKGCRHILDERTTTFDVISCAVGTGATLAGLLAAKEARQRILGFSALGNGAFLEGEVARLYGEFKMMSSADKQIIPPFSVTSAYDFGGYARINSSLTAFIDTFYERSGIPLDYIYTGKMVYGIYGEIRQGRLDGLKILMIHTGGLQGNAGMIKRYDLQNRC